MKIDEARKLLSGSNEHDESPALPVSVLAELTVDDIRDGGSFQVGTVRGNMTHLEWSGCITRRGHVLEGNAEFLETRKYWYAPVGLEQYMDLVRRAVETRHRLRGDVSLTDFDDDGAFVRLEFAIQTSESNLGKAYATVRKTANELEEAAQRASDEVGQRIAEVAARLSGWGSQPLEELVEQVETARSADDKGRSLEELASRLFAQIPGFSVSGRLRTATEEIDVSILNDSSEPRLRRESALVLVECKNWSSKCGKDEFVIFREKLENRNRRCSLGFLISWNGFASTVTKEMLRGSKEGTIIVPITGQQIRSDVRANSFVSSLGTYWDAAVAL
jgi:hypothetical protein